MLTEIVFPDGTHIELTEPVDAARAEAFSRLILDWRALPVCPVLRARTSRALRARRHAPGIACYAAPRAREAGARGAAIPPCRRRVARTLRLLVAGMPSPDGRHVIAWCGGCEFVALCIVHDNQEVTACRS